MSYLNNLCFCIFKFNSIYWSGPRILGHDKIALLLSSLNESTIERNLLGRKLENALLATACLKLYFLATSSQAIEMSNEMLFLNNIN